MNFKWPLFAGSKHLLIAALVFTGWLVSCRSGSFLIPDFGTEGLKPRFEGVVKTRQNLIFRLDRNLVKTNRLGEWDTASFLIFTPKVAGRFTWSATDELVFSPDQGFRFAASYTVHPGPALTKLAPELADVDPIRFETECLQFVRVHPQWVNKDNRTILRLLTEVNQPTDGRILTEAIRVEWQGRVLQVVCRTEGLASKPVFEIPLAQPNGKAGEDDLVLKIIPEKAKPEFRRKWLTRPQTFSIPVPDVETLVVYDAYLDPLADRPILVVEASQEIEPQFQAKHLRIDGIPDSKFLSHMAGIQADGEFQDGALLRFVAEPGLQGKCGGKLGEVATREVRVGEEGESIRFASSRELYLPKNGPSHVAMRISGAEEVDLEVYQISGRNLMFGIQASVNGEHPEYGYEEDNESYPGGGENLGTLLYRRRVLVSELEREGPHRLLPLNIPDRKGQKGAFLVKVFKAGERWQGAKKLICRSDLGLLCKTNPDEIWIKTLSLSQGKPASGVKLEVVAGNNQILCQGISDNEGVCRIPRSRWEDAGSEESLILAETGSDFSFLSLRHTRLDYGRFPVDGNPTFPSGWQAYLQSARNVYQPGEPLSFLLLVRDKDLRPVGQTYFPVKVHNPEGEVIQFFKCRTEVQGQANFTVSLPAGSPTGSFRIEVCDEEGKSLASQSVFVESFEPPSLELSSLNTPRQIAFGRNWNLPLRIDNLFGLPAAQVPVEARLSWEPAEFQPKEFEKYTFLNGQPSVNPPVRVVEKETDATGKTTLLLPTGDIAGNQGLLSLKARIQCRDESGVSVSKTFRTLLMTQPFLIGYRLERPELVAHEPNRISLVCVDAAGLPVPGKARLVVHALQYETVRETAPDEPNGYRYVSRKNRLSSTAFSVNLPSGKGSQSVFIPQSGFYEIEISREEGDPLGETREWFASGGTGDTPPEGEANSEGNVDISLSQPSYQPGETAEVRFQVPFPGLLTLCLEQDRILQHHSLHVEGKTAVWRFPVTSGGAPNVFVSATLTRRMEINQGHNPLTVAYGYVSIPVERRDHKLSLNLTCPSQTPSGRSLPVEIEVGDSENPAITVAFTDEGILQLTDYRMGDPFQRFHEKRQLGVSTFSAFGKLVNNRKPTRSLTGGDGFYMKMGADALDPRIVLTWWDHCGSAGSERIRVVRSGKKWIFKTQIPIPAGFSGRGKLVVVAYGTKGLGIAESAITISDPVVVKKSLPPYLVPGDQYSGHLTFFNTTRETRTLNPVLRAIDRTIRIKTENNRPITLAPGGNHRLEFSLEAGEEGLAKIETGWNSRNRKETSVTPIRISAPARVETYALSGSVGPGESRSFGVPPDLNPSALKGKIWIGRHPLLPWLTALDQLLDYPYGCLEQNVSAAFPLLFLPDSGLSISRFGNRFKRDQTILRTLESLRQFSRSGGGFSYWPGGPDPHPYFSVYATHFLVEARERGFPVDPEWLSAQLNYTANLAKSKDLQVFKLPGKGKEGQRMKLPPSVPYALWVCSRSGRVQGGNLGHWRANREVLDREGRVMLAMAYLSAGDAESARPLLEPQWERLPNPFEGRIPARRITENPEEELAPPYGFGLLSGGKRELAAAAFALGLGWPDHPLSKQLKSKFQPLLQSGSGELSTLEKGMVLTALLFQAKTQESSASRYQINLPPSKQGGKEIAFTDWTQPILLQNRNLKKEGPLYFRIEVMGKRGQTSQARKDQGLEIRRSLWNAFGKPIDAKQVRQNDLLVVRLDVRSLGAVDVPQVALVDVVPASLRIENKRLDQASPYTTPVPPAEPERLDIRRDRIHFFVTARPRIQSYFYSVRVLGQGNFLWSGPDAQAMYFPELQSRDQAVPLQIGAHRANEKNKAGI